MKQAIALAIGGHLAACGAQNALPHSSFELDCSAANTATASQLHCVRTDTRSGELVVIDYMRLPVLEPTTSAGPAGRFTTVCDAASTDTRSDFYCIRMNTETGELALVNLQKVPIIPPR